MTMRRVNGIWSKPTVASFSGKYSDGGPVFSADGKCLYFYSTRPTSDGMVRDDIWFVEKQESGWSEPQCLEFVTRFPELGSVFQPSITQNGTLYFISRQKSTPPGEFLIWRAERINGEYPKLELLPTSINAPDVFVNWTPFIAPDESCLVFSSGRGDDHGGGDLYVTRRGPNKTWAEPEILLSSINTTAQERFPMISPDGKYLFFTRSTPDHADDVFWVSTAIIPLLRPLSALQEKVK
jgi:hypothetical protein